MAAPGETYQRAFFDLETPHISTGLPFPEACAHHLENTFHASRVYIIVSSSISKTENFEKLRQALGARTAGIRYGIKPHTPWDDLLEIINEMRDMKADAIVTLGAGSLTDGAKVISFALANDVRSFDDLADICSLGSKKDSAKPCIIPVINIPTSLSGGEYSPFAGATNPTNHHKASFAHPSMCAQLVILDPALSVSTPAKIWLSTGIRAVDHNVEGLCSLDKGASDLTLKLGQEGLKLLIPNLLKTKREWDALEPRLQEMMGCLKGMHVVRHVPMGASHGIGHQLGPLGVGHGETSCILLPAVMKWNWKHGDEKVREKQQLVLDVLWGDETVAEVLKKHGLMKGTADAGDALDAVIRELGMPRSLADVGVGRDKLEGLAVNALKDRWLPTNPIPVTEKSQVMEILELVATEWNPKAESK